MLIDNNGNSTHDVGINLEKYLFMIVKRNMIWN